MRKIMFVFALLFAAVLSLLGNQAMAASPGAVVITEYMANPAGSDANREWLEVQNVSGASIALGDWLVNDGANHPISGDYLIPDNGVAVICKSDDLELNGGVVCDYTANIVLGNTGDTIYLQDENDSIIDSVSYLEEDLLEGSSRYHDSIWLNDEVNIYDNVNLNYGTPGVIPGVTDGGLQGVVDGNVLLTLLNVAVNVSGTSAFVEFNVNADSDVVLAYGESDLYGMEVAGSVVAGDASLEISDLECDKTYHYRLSAVAGEYADDSGDNTFSVTCGSIDIDSLVMTKSSARANNDYLDGWQWEFAITVWDESETSLQMSFDQWASASNLIDSAGNLHFSVDGGLTWTEIGADGVYSDLIAISDVDLSSAGTQVDILVEMKVPVGTIVGDYSSQYGIRTE